MAVFGELLSLYNDSGAIVFVVVMVFLMTFEGSKYFIINVARLPPNISLIKFFTSLKWNVPSVDIR